MIPKGVHTMTSKYKLVFVAIMALALLVGVAGGLKRTAVAQTGDTTRSEVPAVQAAIEAVNRSFPGIGQPHLFTFTFTEATTDSSLGCPLIEGFVLSQPVVPYRVMLSYGDRQFTYHATADGSLVFPCDEALPIGGPIPPGRIPFTATAATPAEAAIAAFLRSSPGRGFPHSFSYTFTAPTTDSSLGCPLIEGFTLERPVVPYRIVLSYPDGDFVYHAAGDISILFPCDEQLPIGGPVAADSEPFRPATPSEAAIDAFIRAFPERGFPERYEFIILDPTIDGPVAYCPTTGDAIDVTITPYRVTLYSQDLPYVYYVSADSSIIVVCN
jgi:hypothetical protein